MSEVPAVAHDGDPYLAWTLASGWKGHAAVAVRGGLADPDTRIPVLIELKHASDRLDRLDIVTSRLARIPELYRGAAQSAALRYCTASVALGQIEALAAHPEVQRLEMSLPLPVGALGAEATDPQAVAGDVVIGIVDRGFGFLNRVFREAWAGDGCQRSRIVALWDQSVPAAGACWHVPSVAGYGRQLLADDIGPLVDRVSGGDAEAEVYRELDYLVEPNGFPGFPLVIERAHGTHVADTAAGLVPEQPLAASAKPAAPDAAQSCKIIAVNIPALARGDSTGASSGVFLLDAVRYILHRAGPRARVVINMSVGIHGGPHDGSSLTSLALEELLRTQMRQVAITVAAGNSAQERWTTTGTLAAGQQDERVLRVLPNDTTDSFLEVWWAPEVVDKAAGKLQVQVVPPAGLAESPWLSAGQQWQCDTAGGTAAYRLAHLRGSALGSGPMALLALAPTDGPRAAALPGRWTVRLRNVGKAPVAFDAWVQRDEPPYGTSDPIQPSFDDFADDRQGEGCALNDLACGSGVIAVGAARLLDGQEARYSGRMQARRATQRPHVRADADLLALADESVQAIGLFAAAVRSGAVFRMGGTSVAAPVVARKIANAWMTGAAASARVLGSAPPATSKAELMALVAPGTAGPNAARLRLVRP